MTKDLLRLASSLTTGQIQQLIVLKQAEPLLRRKRVLVKELTSINKKLAVLRNKKKKKIKPKAKPKAKPKPKAKTKSKLTKARLDALEKARKARWAGHKKKK